MVSAKTKGAGAKKAYRAEVLSPLQINGFKSVAPGDLLTSDEDIMFVESLPAESAVRSFFKLISIEREETDTANVHVPDNGGE